MTPIPAVTLAQFNKPLFQRPLCGMHGPIDFWKSQDYRMTDGSWVEYTEIFVSVIHEIQIKFDGTTPTIRLGRA